MFFFNFYFFISRNKESQLVPQLFPSAPQHLLYPYILPFPYCEELTKTQCLGEDKTSRTFLCKGGMEVNSLPSMLMNEHIIYLP